MRERALWYTEMSRAAYASAIVSSKSPETVRYSSRFLRRHMVIPVLVAVAVLCPLAIWTRRFSAPPHGSDVLFVAALGAQQTLVRMSPFFSWLLGRPPPEMHDIFLYWYTFVGLVTFGGGWLVQTFYFTGDLAMPSTLLRRARFPMMLGFAAAAVVIMGFLPRVMFQYITLLHATVLLVFAAGCFLGEDPGSTVMAWVCLVLGLVAWSSPLVKGHPRRSGKRRAHMLIAKEKEAYERAWDEVMGAEGASELASALSKACLEVTSAGGAGARPPKDAARPGWGPHVWRVVVAAASLGPPGVPRKPRQPVADIDVLFKLARQLNPHFQDWVRTWAGWGNGAQYVPGPVKHARRAIEKLIRVYGRDAAALTDLVRCTVVFPTLRGVLGFFATVRGRSDVGGIGMLRIRRVKNRLCPSHEDATGYRDLSLLVEVGWLERGGAIEFVPVRDWGGGASRLVCEVQVHVSPVYAVKQAQAGVEGAGYSAYRDMLSR